MQALCDDSRVLGTAPDLFGNLPVRNFGGFGVTQALGIGFAAVDCPVAKKTLTFDLFNRN